MTKEEFLKGVDNWSSHRHLLWPALEATKHLNLPVLELGVGDGSTPFLRQYCRDEGLKLILFDYNKEWAEKYGAIHTNWVGPEFHDLIKKDIYSVCLVDESPGEHRKGSLILVSAAITVIHDSEPIGWNSSDYQVRPLFSRFKYVKDLESEQKGGAWATALSNNYNVTKWKL